MKSLFLSAAVLLAAPLAAATEITVTFSPEFTEKLAEDYGTSEGDYLIEEVTEDVTKAFAEAGVDPARVTITIVDAKPNKPTMEQLRDEPGLDYFRSVSIGGATFEGIAYSDTGEVLATVEYDWYENDIRNVAPSGTWTDASRASSRFAKRFAEQLD